MAVQIDATIGGASSNCYVTLVRGKELLDELPHADDFLTDASSSKQSQLLVHSTQLIDRSFNFRGAKTNTSQALAWPRQISIASPIYNVGWAWYGDGDEYTSDAIAPNEIPDFLEWATVEWAFSLFLDSTQQHSPAPGLNSLRTPSFSMEFSNTGKRKVPTTVMQLLMPYGEQRYAGGVRLIRA